MSVGPSPFLALAMAFFEISRISKILFPSILKPGILETNLKYVPESPPNWNVFGKPRLIRF